MRLAPLLSATALALVAVTAAAQNEAQPAGNGLSGLADTLTGKTQLTEAEAKQVLNDFRPNILANYLFELANSFHTFYEACPVLRSEEPVRSSRLALAHLSGRVLQKGLDLLGIKVPDRM